MLSIGENFSAIERNNVICDDFDALGGEIVVVDAEVGVEPVDFIDNELAWDEALNDGVCQYTRRT